MSEGSSEGIRIDMKRVWRHVKSIIRNDEWGDDIERTRAEEVSETDRPHVDEPRSAKRVTSSAGLVSLCYDVIS